MPVRALRGATTVDADTPDQIRSRVNDLMTTLFDRNQLSADDVISVLVTATPDLRSFHPATAVRAWGLNDVPLMGAQELDIKGSLRCCIRVMLHIDTPKSRAEIAHVFLEGAVVLRPDLATKSAGGKPVTAARRANVVGLGLIGGSVGMALRAQGWFVTGTDLNPVACDKAVSRHAVDRIGLDPDADLTVVATPVMRTADAVLEALRVTTGLVTDVGSVKAPIAAAIDDPRFVGGHPMAGSELEGIDGSYAEMFQGAVWVLTPTATTADDTFSTVAEVARSLGAEVVALPPQRHDALVAVVSHVPHLTAATLMRLADARAEEHAALLRLAAGGFRDMTRIAAGHPAIWLDICAQNRDAIVEALDGLIGGLRSMRDIVAAGEREALSDVLTRARIARTNLPSRVAHTDQLAEARVPIPDRPGAAAEVFTLAAELGVNLADFEVLHSAEGERGIMVLLIDAAMADLFRGGLIARGFRPNIRRLE